VLPNRGAADAQYAAGYAAALAALGFAGDPKTLPHPASTASAAVASAQASQQRELLGWMSTQPERGAQSSHPYTPATHVDMQGAQGLVGLTPAPVPRKATFAGSLAMPTQSQVRCYCFALGESWALVFVRASLSNAAVLTSCRTLTLLCQCALTALAP
jgi:hypothetical protein